MSLRGSMGVLQLVETTLLNCSNYPTLIATLAHSIKRQSGAELIEDGLKFAQTQVAGLLGAKYGFVGGVDC